MISLGIFSLWFLSDQPLDDQARDAISLETKPITDSNGFVYLLGIDASESENPYLLGESRLNHYRQWIKYPTLTVEPASPGVRAYHAPSWFDGSNETLISHVKDIPYLIIANEPIISHYQAFLTFNEFETLMLLDSSASDALIKNLKNGNHFLHADVIAKAFTGDDREAALILMNDISNWRKQMQLADTFAHKQLAANLLIDDFLLISTITKHGVWSQETIKLIIQSLEPFSLKEISLEKPLLTTEYSKLGNMLLLAKQQPNLINAQQYSALSFRIRYKPNMSANFLYREYLRIANQINLPPKQLSANMSNQHYDLHPSLTEWLKNSLGVSAVENLLAINYSYYTARLWDIDIARLLVRLSLEAQLNNIHTESELIAFINQPTFRDIWHEQTPHYSAKTGEICYDGPTDDQRKWRCANIEWLLLHKRAI